MAEKTPKKTPPKKVKKEVLSQDQKRAIALDLYLNTDFNQKQICEVVGWTEKTFRENKEKYKWEGLKGAQTITANSIVSKLYLKIEKLLDKDEEDINADALIKISKSIEHLSDKKVTLSHHINCAKEFCTWAFAKDAELAKKINVLQAEFIIEKGNNG